MLNFVTLSTFLSLLTVSIEVFSTAMPVNFTQEPELAQKINADIDHFWQTGTFSHFQGLHNTRINYGYFHSPSTERCLVIVPGRSESYLKYRELAYDLSQQQFNVFILDHRGQGLSGRMASNPNKGYVEHFDSYALDLHTFISTVVNPTCQGTSDQTNKPYILAHSMGGTIALRLMQRHPSLIKAAVLASPMIAINSGNIPRRLARAVIAAGSWLNHLLDQQPWYFLGQKNYQATTFSENELSHSAIRYQIFLDTYNSNNAIQLGGVTFQWLKASLQAQALIFEELDKLVTPIEILQAGDDTVVDNPFQNRFCAKLQQQQHQQHSCPSKLPKVITGAKHELFNESDHYRNQALTYALAWFNQFP